MRRVSWQNPAHFFAICARQTRILTDFFRSGQDLKRGGGAERSSHDESAVVSAEVRRDLLAIDEALSQTRCGSRPGPTFAGGMSSKRRAAENPACGAPRDSGQIYAPAISIEETS